MGWKRETEINCCILSLRKRTLRFGLVGGEGHKYLKNKQTKKRQLLTPEIRFKLVQERNHSILLDSMMKKYLHVYNKVIFKRNLNLGPM